MKTEQLKEMGLTEEQIAAVMAENGKDVEKVKTQAETEKKRADGLQGQLDDANKEIKSYEGMDIEGIKKAAGEWKEKAEKADEANKAKIAELENDFAAKDAASGLKFSSESAKRAFIGDLRAKKLPIQDGKFLGFDDFLKDYKDTDASAFVDEKTPTVVKGTGGGQSLLGDTTMRAAMGLPPVKE